MFADELEGNIYSGFSKSNVTELIEKIKLLEGAEAGWPRQLEWLPFSQHLELY